MPYFDSERKRHSLKTPFDTCFSTLSHKLTCALFVAFYQLLAIPRNHHWFDPRTSLSVRRAEPNITSEFVIMTNPKNEDARCVSLFLQKRPKQRDAATRPTNSCSIKWHLMSSLLGISPTTINSSEYPIVGLFTQTSLQTPLLSYKLALFAEKLFLFHFIFILNNGLCFYCPQD